MMSDNVLSELVCTEWSHPPRKHDRFWTYVNVIITLIGAIIILLLCFLLMKSYAHNDDILRIYAERLEELETTHQRKIDLRDNALARAKRDETIDRNSAWCLCPSTFHLEPKTPEHRALNLKPVQGYAFGRGTSEATVATGAPQVSGIPGAPETTRAPWTTGGPEAPMATWATLDPAAPGSPHVTGSPEARGARGAPGAPRAPGVPGGQPRTEPNNGVNGAIGSDCHEQICWVCSNGLTAGCT